MGKRDKALLMSKKIRLCRFTQASRKFTVQSKVAC